MTQIRRGSIYTTLAKHGKRKKVTDIAHPKFSSLLDLMYLELKNTP
jgi:hypothetical protein